MQLFMFANPFFVSMLVKPQLLAFFPLCNSWRGVGFWTVLVVAMMMASLADSATHQPIVPPSPLTPLDAKLLPQRPQYVII